MKKIIIFSLTLFILGFSSQAWAADVAKIGVVNFQKILDESSAGKMTQKQLAEKHKELQDKLTAEKNAIDELNKAFEREALVLSPEKQQERKREWQIRVRDFNQMKVEFAKELKLLEGQLVGGMQKEVFEIVDTIGKEEGYLLVLEKKAGGVIFNPEQIDITDQVIKKYNLKVSKTK